MFGLLPNCEKPTKLECGNLKLSSMRLFYRAMGQFFIEYNRRKFMSGWLPNNIYTIL